jgi:hypothetical protein
MNVVMPIVARVNMAIPYQKWRSRATVATQIEARGYA